MCVCVYPNSLPLQRARSLVLLCVHSQQMCKSTLTVELYTCILTLSIAPTPVATADPARDQARSAPPTRQTDRQTDAHPQDFFFFLQVFFVSKLSVRTSRRVQLVRRCRAHPFSQARLSELALSPAKARPLLGLLGLLGLCALAPSALASQPPY
jgi:hypothetical protein